MNSINMYQEFLEAKKHGLTQQILEGLKARRDLVPIINEIAPEAVKVAKREAQTALKAKIDQSARRTIRVAAALPLTMAIAFGLIILWFRSQGGYKPIELHATDAE